MRPMNKLRKRNPNPPPKEKPKNEKQDLGIYKETRVWSGQPETDDRPSSGISFQNIVKAGSISEVELETEEPEQRPVRRQRPSRLRHEQEWEGSNRSHAAPSHKTGDSHTASGKGRSYRAPHECDSQTFSLSSPQPSKPTRPLPLPPPDLRPAPSSFPRGRHSSTPAYLRPVSTATASTSMSDMEMLQFTPKKTRPSQSRTMTLAQESLASSTLTVSEILDGPLRPPLSRHFYDTPPDSRRSHKPHSHAEHTTKGGVKSRFREDMSVDISYPASVV